MNYPLSPKLLIRLPCFLSIVKYNKHDKGFSVDAIRFVRSKESGGYLIFFYGTQYCKNIFLSNIINI